MEPENHTSQRKSHLLTNALPRKFFTIVLIAAAIIIVFLAVRNSLSNDRKTASLQFKDIGELATQSAYCTVVNKTDAARTLFGRTIPFTQSTYVYSYDVEIKAGFDFSEIDWSLNEATSAIEVKLPEVRTLSKEIDLDSFQVYLEDESVFRQIRLEETNNAIAALQQQAEDDAIENGLYENARVNAEALLRSFFASAYDLEKYELKFV